MAHRTSRQGNGSFLLPSVTTLAMLRLRKTWFLLTITALGVIAAVIITCTIPLFSDMMITAGLRETLNTSPQSSEIPVYVDGLGLSTSIVNALHSTIEAPIHAELGSLARQTQFTISVPNMAFTRPVRPNSLLSTYGLTTQYMQTQLGHIQGRDVQVTSDPTKEIEVMLSSATAKQLGLTTGSTFGVTMSYALVPSRHYDQAPAPLIQLPFVAKVVGIFTESAATSALSGTMFDPISIATEQATYYTYTMVTSTDTLLALADALSKRAKTQGVYAPANSGGYELQWTYTLDTLHINVRDLNSLSAHLDSLQITYLNTFGISGNTIQFPYITDAQLNGPLFGSATTLGLLDNYQSRVSVAHVPTLILTIQIIALVLFFISLLTNLLAESQAQAIALIRSRGASRLQVFSALLLQSVLIAVFAIIIGVPLSIVTALLLAQHTLPMSEQNALNVVTTNLFQSGERILPYAGAVALVVVITMGVTLFFAANSNVLSMRRESARSSRRPLWQRLNLDIIAGMFALFGYGLSLYLTSVGTVLQGNANTLIKAPLSIIAPFFLVLACILLFLRLFPFILRLGAYIATRQRGAVALLAVTQIARTPRQALRMTMLLALAIAFALFTLVFIATQVQHISDIGTYLTGADFSGSPAEFDDSSTDSGVSNNPAKAIRQYQAIPGVLSASVGYETDGQAGNVNQPVQIRAVDSATFINMVDWTSTADARIAHALAPRLKTLVGTGQDIPVIVDTNITQDLQLHIGSTFVIREDEDTTHDLNCIIIGVVQHIPTTNDRTSTNTGLGNQVISPGGVIMDYQLFSTVYVQQAKKNAPTTVTTAPTINTVWLRTKDDSTSLASVRQALTTTALALNQLTDRRALLASLDNDPLYVVINGILGIGTVTALLLALVGDLLSSWLSAKARLTNFTILRALGSSPRQVLSVLVWEQGVVYVTGLLLGVVLGLTFAFTVVPTLTFTDLNSTFNSSAFYYLQSSISTTIVLPSSLPIVLAILAAIFFIALTMMTYVVTSPMLSQTLRLNED